MRDLGMIRNAPYTLGFQKPMYSSTQSGFKGNYSRYLVAHNKPTNNSFYSFGGKRSIRQARDEEFMVSPALLSNTEHFTRTQSKITNVCP
jgi:hypothetical protein